MTKEKRIKRNVLSQEWRWKAITQPSLKETLYQELKEKEFSQLEREEDGVSFQGKIIEGYRANLTLGTTSKINLILKEFRAGAPEQLFKEISQFPWDLWFSTKTTVVFKLFLNHSPISNHKLAEKTCLEAYQKFWNRQGSTEESLKEENDHQTIQVYIIKNRATLSLSCSREGLYRRGYKINPGIASIRSDIALAILKMPLKEKPFSIIVDGMCGSGTLTIETLLELEEHYKNKNHSFSFFKWESFQPQQWQYLLNQEKINPLRTQFYSIDISGQQLSSFVENLQRINFLQKVNHIKKDFFTINPLHLEGLEQEGKKLLLLNPPYGKRLTVEIKDFYRKLESHLKREYKGWLIIILHPEEIELSLPITHQQKFRHGGLIIKATCSQL